MTEDFKQKARKFVETVRDTGMLVESYCVAFHNAESVNKAVTSSEIAAKAIALFTQCQYIVDIVKELGPLTFSTENFNQKVIAEGIMSVCQDAKEAHENIPALRLQLDCYKEIAKLQGIYDTNNASNTNANSKLIDILHKEKYLQ